MAELSPGTDSSLYSNKHLQGLVRDCDVGLYLHDAGISFFEKIEDAVTAYQSDRLN